MTAIPTLQTAITVFIAARRSENLSEKTLTWYAAKLSAFIKSAGDMALTDVQPDHVRQYMTALRDRKTRYPGQDRESSGTLSPHTIAGHDRMLRTFFNWCMIEYDLPSTADPMRKVKKPRTGETEPKAMTIDDLIRMLGLCEAEGGIFGLRNRAILLFFADTGCRVGGLIGLTDRDIDLDNRRATVTEKGNRARSVFMNDLTISAIRAWLAVRPPGAMAVFCAIGGRGHSAGQPLHVEGVHKMLQRIGQAADVKGRCNPHSLRHMFAMLNLESGNDLLTTSQLLGHRDLKTTERYVHWTDNDRARKHDKHSPINALLERLKV